MKDEMNLSKKTDRGSCKMLYDKEDKVLIGQWNDNKVVNFVSMLNDGGIGCVKCQVGNTKIELSCPNSLIAYQQKMGGVDKGDQMRGHMAGFSNKVHFKKWYKRVYLAILDCGLLNSFVAWNMSAEDRSNARFSLTRHAFYHYVAHKMCNYIDPVLLAEEESATAIEETQVRAEIDGHKQVRAKSESKCSVCILEWKWRDELPQDQQNTITGKGHKTNVALCEKCGIKAHAIRISSERQNRIHKLPEFNGMSCFEIMHTPQGQSIWPRNPVSCNHRKKYDLNQRHPIVNSLREAYGLSRQMGKRKASSTQTSTVNQDE